MANEIRAVAYIDTKLSEWVKKEAKKLGMTESTFIRFVLLQFKKKAS